MSFKGLEYMDRNGFLLSILNIFKYPNYPLLLNIV